MGSFNEYDIKQKKRQRWLNKNWMLLVGLLIIVIGIGLIIFSNYIPGLVSEKVGEESNGEKLASVVMTVGQVFISVSITALLFERMGYVDYTVNRVCDALAREEVLNILSDARKKELKDMLFEDIYLGRHPNQDSKELVEQLDADIGELLSENIYYEEYHTSCDISIITAQDGQRYFQKYIHRVVVARPIQNGKPARLNNLFYIRTNGIPAGTKDEHGAPIVPIEFLSIKINENQELKEGRDYSVQCETDGAVGPYSIHYKLQPKDEKILEVGKYLRLEIAYKSHVLSTDPMYSITVYKPCKFFSCHFNNNIQDYNLHVKSYGFMSPGSSNRRMHIETQNGVTVRFRSWILPGDGALAMLTPKQSVPLCPIYMASTPKTYPVEEQYSTLNGESG